MKKILSLILVSFALNTFAASLYDFSLKKTNEDYNLKELKGKSVLIVNIATKCGYTGQLEGLEKVYAKYKDQGFVVLGIPSNDFGGQTPEENKEVKKFCKLKYGANFPITNKIVVKGDGKDPLYKYLIGLTDNKEIEWNFTKFLFDKTGKLVKRYRSSVTPESDDLIKDIKNTL